MREDDIRMLPAGSHFNFKGFEWIALDNNVDGGVLAVMTSSWNEEEYRFDEDRCNNYANQVCVESYSMNCSLCWVRIISFLMRLTW